MPTLHPTNGQSHPGEITKVQPTAQHTPGPWRADDTEEIVGSYEEGDRDFAFTRAHIYDGSGGIVAEVYAHTDIPTVDANARLIAAAPDLLDEYRELLKRLADAAELCIQGHSQVAEELCHEMALFKSPAIAKATNK